MDRCHRSAIYKGLRITHGIPNSTQYDTRQRCPALVVLKEEINNNNNNLCHHQSLLLFFTLDLKHISSSSLLHHRLHIDTHWTDLTDCRPDRSLVIGFVLVFSSQQSAVD